MTPFKKNAHKTLCFILTQKFLKNSSKKKYKFNGESFFHLFPERVTTINYKQIHFKQNEIVLQYTK